MIRKIVLIVDDDDTTAGLVESTLGEYYQILHVSRGLRAMPFTRAKQVQLVILSEYLQDTAGLSILRALKRNLPHIPVIIVSENATKESILRTFRNGANDFLEKPLDQSSLENACCNLLNSSSSTGNNGDLAQSAEMVKKIPAKEEASRQKISWSERSSRFFCKMLKQTSTPPPQNIVQQTNPNSQSNQKNKSTELAEPNEPLMQISFFGKFQVILNETRLDHWPSRKAKILFAYLAYHHKRSQYKDVLMDKFWPHSSRESARNCLNATIYSLRHLFHSVDPEQEYILFKDDCYLINPEVDIWQDVEEFSYYWRKARSTELAQGIEPALSEFELAAAQYKGDFLEEEIYESWAELDRENLKEIYLVILDRISDYYGNDGKPATAAELCETILEKDNCREDVHQRLMRCYYRLGQRSKALKQFRKCQEILQKELEVSPTQATIHLYESIKHEALSEISNEKSTVSCQ